MRNKMLVAVLAVAFLGLASAGLRAEDKAAPFDKDSCCAKAYVNGKLCAHKCCKEAAAANKVCKSCNAENGDKALFTADGCCAKAAAKGEACTHPCCVAAAKEGKVCGKCNK